MSNSKRWMNFAMVARAVFVAYSILDVGVARAEGPFLADAAPPSDGSPYLSESSTSASSLMSAEHPVGNLWIFAGLDAGTMSVSTSAAGEASQSGYQIRPKLLASYYFNEDFALDAGAGWSRFVVDTPTESATVATRAGFVEVSPKWRPSERWQIGPVADVYFGADMSFAESVQNSGAAFLGGAQGQFDLPVASAWRMRLGATLLTTIGVADRQAFTAMAGLQIGLPVARLK